LPVDGPNGRLEFFVSDLSVRMVNDRDDHDW
jgi:hypothetical protein